MSGSSEGFSLFEFNVAAVLLVLVWLANVGSVHSTPYAMVLFAGAALLGVFLVQFGKKEFGVSEVKTLSALCVATVFGFGLGVVSTKSWASVFGSLEFVSLVFLVLPAVARLVRVKFVKAKE
ncbi:hypothetical protein HY992_04775 [Candidatus Micrarchaeota archaeon]|nr:hypothetical protein [Candidatus Micrarchaeota archaeon]